MAHESSGAPAKASWTKIFTAFKVALDVKKLILAAAGITLVAVGWAFFGWTFAGVRGAAPEWKVFEDKDKKEPEQRQAQWAHFKSRRESWNLLHELAGSPSELRKKDAADVTNDPDEYVLLHEWEEAYQRLSHLIVIKGNTLEVPKLESNQKTFKLTPIGDAKLPDQTLTVQALTIDPNQDKKIIIIDGVMATVDDGKFEELKTYRLGALTPAQITAKAAKVENQKVAQDAVKIFNTHLVHPKYKPAGKLRVWPWSEDRGENQYLLVASVLKTPTEAKAAPGNILFWLFSEKALVLLEPLVKFLTPVVYLFDARAAFMDRLYLIFIIVWTLAIWGFFGGAICRIAAVQIARNERISLTEAIAFTRERYVSFVAAPVFPMVLLGIFTLLLMIFGWVEWIPWFGDVFAGIFWPLVILIGFTMAVVLVGLVGWPLMVGTISTEGTDSFDALSRSYSYVYQAPWQYLWYNFLAVVYGAVLIFFVGFMASLMIFLGKWGVSSAAGLSSPNPEKDREPSYLFYYAPTSYGWRDLLISSNTQYVEKRKKTTPEGREVEHLEFKPEYEKHIGSMNTFGAFLVACWVYPFFLLVLGFGYSYFWSVSTIIYFLIRNFVDDTAMDEVHQEDEDLDDPFMKSTTPPAAPAPAPAKNKLSLNIVEGPPPAPTPPPAPPPPFTPPPPASPPVPPSTAKTTQLAIDPPGLPPDVPPPPPSVPPAPPPPDVPPPAAPAEVPPLSPPPPDAPPPHASA